MKNKVKFFSSVFFLSTHIALSAFIAATFAQSSNCAYYKDLFSVVLKSGSQSEISQARYLMNKHCQAPVLNPTTPGSPSRSPIVSPRLPDSNQVKNYWTKERIKDVKPAMPTLPGSGLSGSGTSSCSYIYKPYCQDGRQPISFRDSKGCVISYKCPISDKTSKCPFNVVKPSNCPSQQFVPITKDGCVVQYYCKPQDVIGNCPPANWNINCPDNLKQYSKDSRGCYFVSCMTEIQNPSSPIKPLTPPATPPMPSAGWKGWKNPRQINLNQDEVQKQCDKYSMSYIDRLSRFGSDDRGALNYKKLSEYYCGGSLKIQR